MYKIIIADDEKFIQEGLVNLIDWKSLGFEIAGVFEDGADVIEYLNTMPVDVVLTDIKMKHISGIVTAKYIYENEIPCKVVFISGYKEFDLVLQAIKYGVEDYILKPSKVEEVRTIFQKIKNELDEKKKNIEFNKKVGEHWAEIYPILEEKFLNDLAMGALSEEKDIRQRMMLLYPEIDVENSPCMFVDLCIENYETFIEEKWNYSAEQFDEAIYNFINILDSKGSFHVVSKKKDKIRMFVITNEYRTTWEENVTLFDEICTGLIRQFKEIFNLEISLIPEQYFKNVFQMAKQKVDDLSASKNNVDIKQQMKEQKKLIITNIMLGNISTAQKMMHHILLKLERIDERGMKNFAIEIFSNISNLLQENNQALFVLVQPYLDYHRILDLKSSRQLVEYCDRIFDIMKSKEAMSDKFDKDSVVNRIKEYVNEHIYEDIMLENVADELFISTQHVNRILKKQIGETFLQYVTRKKMEKAVELLHDPQYKVYQVGERLGYKTSRYFSKLFYNFIGYYPSQYRKEVLKIGDDSNEEG